MAYPPMLVSLTTRFISEDFTRHMIEEEGVIIEHIGKNETGVHIQTENGMLVIESMEVCEPPFSRERSASIKATACLFARAVQRATETQLLGGPDGLVRLSFLVQTPHVEMGVLEKISALPTTVHREGAGPHHEWLTIEGVYPKVLQALGCGPHEARDFFSARN